jgi:hypothetical protein
MYSRRIVGQAALMCLAISCSSHPDSNEVVATSTAAVTATSQVSVAAWTASVWLPSWGNLGPLGQALTGTQSVAIGASAKVQSPASDIRKAIIASGGPVSIQPDAVVVGVVAAGAIDLRDRVHVTGSVATASITMGNNVTIDGKKAVASVPPLGDSVTWTASTPAASVPGWDLQPGQAQSLLPGRYGALAVKNGAKLTLSAAGRYFFESLDLESGSTLEILSADQPTEIYVHGSQLILRGALSGATGLEERLVIVYDGTNEVFLESPLRGAIIAPSAQVTLRATSSPHRGAAFAKTVLVDAGAILQPVMQPFLLALSSLPVAKCAWSLPPRSTGNKLRDEYQYQYEILKYCVMRGYPDDELRLRGQFNYEAGESAAAMSICAISPSQYLGFVRRRQQQLKNAATDPVLARKIVAGPDADGDWVPDGSDTCSGTAKWMPVDDNGCPLPLPPGPDCQSVKALMDKTGIFFNPACTESAGIMPNIEFAAGVYMPAKPEEGVFLYVQDLPAQPAGCEPWFEFEIRSTKNKVVVDHFNVAFPYSSASHTGKFVAAIPSPYVQLRALPNMARENGRLGKMAQALSDHTIDELVYRVRAVSGVGTQGAWGSWVVSVPQDCRSVGFKCE